MDDSQNSDIFSISDSEIGKSSNMMDTGTYESLVSNTKMTLSKGFHLENHKSTFTSNFSSLLQDCHTCVSQSIDLVTQLLSDKNIQLSKICEYMEDAVSLLQMLSHFIKKALESVSMSCSNLKTFPSTTGRIIMTVFAHCKDSELLYGVHLKGVEKQLKDLFRTCQELQFMYLMILEKHLVFDLEEKKELDILIEALDINLEIVVIVQALDVKTMAEQWKGYTMICEKYSNYLLDKHICGSCTKLLCTLIKNNIKTAIEVELEEKVIMRSLKVASFTIKILLKVCSIFRQATSKNYQQVVELLLCIHLYENNCAYIESSADRSEQMSNMLNTTVSIPTKALLRELLLHAEFFNCVLQYQTDLCGRSTGWLAYILLLVSVTKSVLPKNDNFNVSKKSLVNCIFKLLPYGHIWFNLDLKFETEVKPESGYQTCTLYEYLLTHVLALALTLTSPEMNTLEQRMYEGVLDTNCITALFSSNLWILLARYTPRQYSLSQLIFLCKTYQKLNTNRLFANSPQKTHLTHTICRLFESMNCEDKLRVYKQFSIHDDGNGDLWSALRIRNLPSKEQNYAQGVILGNLQEKFHKVFTVDISSLEEIRSLDKTMVLAASCSSIYEETLEEYIMTAWLKACPKNNKYLLSSGELDKSSAWYLTHIEALIHLTISMKNVFHKSSNLVKILHVVSNIMENDNTELKLLLTRLICNSSLCTIHDENEHLANSLILQTYKTLFQDSDEIVRNKFYGVLREYRHNKKVNDSISAIMDTDEETWMNFSRHGTLSREEIDLKAQLAATFDNTYSHKCIEDNAVIELTGSLVTTADKTSSNNFDFADIDTLFETDTEPARKKIKLISDDIIEEIVARLESDTEYLCDVKENVANSVYKSRIQNVCEKLKNIID